MMVDQLLTLFQLPSIIDSGSATPPNLQVHKAPMAALRSPIAAYAGDPRYARFAAWHAKMNGQNQLMAFETHQ